ncbi:acetate--CoA ligase family protein [Patescibacteria group bacterium]|nr:acetate--CoA ligase family protein [Patescibacteria group bacterium]MDE1946373.1 acetate--CoA ligase family protein [Patescibacteria group bacterium]MDE2010825.1 acetate--CoA ligase family protein [Patescibacteria group bacterium]MDE2233115.1 acetate--CoA ligase family protein [Patescibacteria group bacterium]
MKVSNFFNPKSVAIIGASSDKNKVGYAIISNLMAGAKREIYPVSISEQEIVGLKAYKSVKEIQGNIDLALIAVRADIVPQIIQECADKKVPAVVIIAAGFREIGEKGRELEEKCAEIAKRNGIALLGPNCLGVIDAQAELNASFAAQKPLKGNIAFVSQSGALGTSILDLALKENVGFSKFVSLGNEASLTEIEFLEYLADDDNTKAILIYLEKLSNGAEFMRLASKITKTKPIVVLKAGRSKRGLRAVMSHTGSLAPEDKVFTAACRQSGIVTVESIREFFNMAKLFQLGITKPLRKFIILTNGGGPSVVTADLVDLSRSLSLVELSQSTQDALRKVLPPMAAFGNPVDIIGDALSDRYKAALDILAYEKEADGILALLTPQMMTEVESTAKLLVEYGNKKPIIPVFLGGPTVEKGLEVLARAGMPNFHFPKDAVEALDALAGAGVRDLQDPSSNKSANIGGSADLKMMPFEDMRALFEKYGIRLNGVLVKEKHDIVKAISKINEDPYVLKAMSPDIIHKTDAGAVALNIRGVEEAQKAWDEIMRNIIKDAPRAKLDGVWVQTMGFGKETIVGMKRDPIFGSTVLFGLGGIFTEALNDTSIRVAPVDERAALQMIHEIKGVPVLSGIRGEKAVDFEALADVIVKISKLSVEHPEIKEIDLNPVMASPDGIDIVDARVMVDS